MGFVLYARKKSKKKIVVIVQLIVTVQGRNKNYKQINLIFFSLSSFKRQFYKKKEMQTNICRRKIKKKKIAKFLFILNVFN